VILDFGCSPVSPQNSDAAVTEISESGDEPQFGIGNLSRSCLVSKLTHGLG
jgi:hypothetical protein